MHRDFGVYAFYNAEEFRTILCSIKNDNMREYIFADVVSKLVEHAWKMTGIMERDTRDYGVNAASDILAAVYEIYRHRIGQGNIELGDNLKSLSSDYLLDGIKIHDMDSFLQAVKAHVGPLHFFHWWNELW